MHSSCHIALLPYAIGVSCWLGEGDIPGVQEELIFFASDVYGLDVGESLEGSLHVGG